MTACRNCKYLRTDAGSRTQCQASAYHKRVLPSFNYWTGEIGPSETVECLPAPALNNGTVDCPLFAPKPKLRDNWREWLGYMLFGGQYYESVIPPKTEGELVHLLLEHGIYISYEDIP
jgi:hypothetical protein